MKYRKKPVVVEAFQFTDDVDMVAPKWFTQAVIYGCTINRSDGRLFAKPG